MSVDLERVNALLLAGHFHGAAVLRGLRADRKLRSLIKVRRVWADIGNNVGRRLYRHGKDPMVEQYRIVEAAMDNGYVPEHIVRVPFDGDLLCSLIEELDLGLLIVATYGGLIPLEAIEMVGGHFYVVHPSKNFAHNCVRLPADCRGARVMDAIVNTGEQQDMRMVLLKGNERFDDGTIVGKTLRFSSPHFTEAERASDRIAERVMAAQRHSAVLAEELVRFHLVRQLFSPERCLRVGYTPRELFDEQGFELSRLFEAGIQVPNVCA